MLQSIIARHSARSLLASRARPLSNSASLRAAQDLPRREPGVNDHHGKPLNAFRLNSPQMYLLFFSCVAIGVLAGSLTGGQQPEGVKEHGGTVYRQKGYEVGGSGAAGHDSVTRDKGVDRTKV